MLSPNRWNEHPYQNWHGIDQRCPLSINIFTFATLVANKNVHSPHFLKHILNCLTPPQIWWITRISGSSLLRPFELFFSKKVWYISWNFIKVLSKIFCSWSIQCQRHSPHFNDHSQHVASGEWVGQRCNRWIGVLVFHW